MPAKGKLEVGSKFNRLEVLENLASDGNFEVALMELIETLCEASDPVAPYGKESMMFSSMILRRWDKTRGKDWFTSTKRGENK